MAENQYTTRNLDPASIIIGFSGSIGSGCSTIAKTIAELRGYQYFSLSAPIYEYAEKNNLPKTRQSLQSIGNDMRKDISPHILAQRTVEIIDASLTEQKIHKIIIDSIRNDMEVRFFKQFPNFYLISVYADQEIRFQRLYKINPAYSKAEFMKDDMRDANEFFPYGQQVEKCNYLSDIVINNQENKDTSVPKQRRDYVNEKISPYLDLIEKGPSLQMRPKMTEKIMTLAYMESLFSTCLQRKVGAVVTTQDGTIISSGFNHVPVTEKTCKDDYEGCYRAYLKKQHAEKIKYCPSCGTPIKLFCHGCNKAFDSTVCPSCGEPYTCEKCHNHVFDIFIPGGKKSIGKLLDVCRALHAEENALINMSKTGGIPHQEMILYTTTFPCTLCANKITQVAINKVIYSETYTMHEARGILEGKQISLEKFEGVKSAAFFRLYGY